MTDAVDVFAVLLILGAALGLAWLISPYLARVYRRVPGRLDRLLNPVEKGIYRLVGVDTEHGMGWKEYFFAGLLINIVQMALAFLILTFQGSLPLNPKGFPGLNWSLSLNTVVSFATNTNLQHYAGETHPFLSQSDDRHSVPPVHLRGHGDMHGSCHGEGLRCRLERHG